MAYYSAGGRDRLYLGFFLIHAISAICVDVQPLLPPALQLDVFKRLLDFYLENTSDPLMLSARLQDPNYLWFRWFLIHEALFFMPCFILGIRGLLKGTPSIYPILLAYAAAASTTTATCFVVLVLGDHKVPLTPTQFMFLLSAYGPFFLIPAVMLVDMYHRIHRLIGPDPSKLKGKKKA
ncbi:hypothetical protein PTTG_25289 [Puccinia triticina 1-1 BBBD Race 1]|uniref:Efficient mitochondria targeting-associated protein 19 n=2 Tax=Puccinia triticina TaxID=208348 RepID=A0A180H448_PUCT1|nr:uncharacterized protein PtA15_2A575 [Puccinia triticina]OAV99765.1 hypothetical protein PTTG_25289 [Puccinia triticina 1-1 BBBD Race 1]WAQ82258.1 hypothetical protein PtA15_2A575 [Puccinia triticina]WAR53112.1 hypothetical protein PtB15_2B543 [Puccinia triticina]